MKFLTAVSLAYSLASSSAFVQKSTNTANIVPLEACISKSEILKSPNTIEFGKIWDPLGLTEVASDETMAWFRHSEIKHGRVAMAAVSFISYFEQDPMIAFSIHDFAISTDIPTLF